MFFSLPIGRGSHTARNPKDHLERSKKSGDDDENTERACRQGGAGKGVQAGGCRQGGAGKGVQAKKKKQKRRMIRMQATRCRQGGGRESRQREYVVVKGASKRVQASRCIYVFKPRCSQEF